MSIEKIIRANLSTNITSWKNLLEIVFSLSIIRKTITNESMSNSWAFLACWNTRVDYVNKFFISITNCIVTCVYVEKHSQTTLLLLNMSMLNNRKTAMTLKSRYKNSLSSSRRRRLTKTTNTIFEIENTSRLKLSSFFKTQWKIYVLTLSVQCRW